MNIYQILTLLVIALAVLTEARPWRRRWRPRQWRSRWRPRPYLRRFHPSHSQRYSPHYYNRANRYPPHLRAYYDRLDALRAARAKQDLAARGVRRPSADLVIVDPNRDLPVRRFNRPRGRLAAANNRGALAAREFDGQRGRLAASNNDAARLRFRGREADAAAVKERDAVKLAADRDLHKSNKLQLHIKKEDSFKESKGFKLKIGNSRNSGERNFKDSAIAAKERDSAALNAGRERERKAGISEGIAQSGFGDLVAGRRAGEAERSRSGIQASRDRGSALRAHDRRGSERFENQANNVEIEAHHDVEKSNKLEIVLNKHDVHDERNRLKFAKERERAAAVKSEKDVELDAAKKSSSALEAEQEQQRLRELEQRAASNAVTAL